MAKSGEPNTKSEREKRLAAELRANLRRRKTQGRAKDDTPPESAADSTETNQTGS